LSTFHDRYEFVMQALQRRRAYIAAGVIRLGQIQFSEGVETAALVAEGRDVQLLFNPEFSRNLAAWELAGVLVHEALHLVLQHQKRFEQLRRQEDRFLFNLACDAVINDLILACYPELKLPGKPVTGPWLVAVTRIRWPPEEVYRLLFAQATANPALWQRLSRRKPWMTTPCGMATVPGSGPQTPRRWPGNWSPAPARKIPARRPCARPPATAPRRRDRIGWRPTDAAAARASRGSCRTP